MKQKANVFKDYDNHRENIAKYAIQQVFNVDSHRWTFKSALFLISGSSIYCRYNEGLDYVFYNDFSLSTMD